jgi:hypothetical protein
MLRHVLPIALGLLLLPGGCDGCAPPGGGGGGGGEEGDGEGEGGPAIPGLIALTIDPADVQLTTDGLQQPTQDFTVTATLRTGGTTDATALVAFELTNPGLGALIDNRFVSAGLGGESELIARIDGVEARARIRVRVQTILIGDGNSADGGDVPADAADLFDDEGPLGPRPIDDDRAPDLVYPNDGVLLPRNLGVIEVHWRRGSDDNTLFAVTFQSSVLQAQVLTRCVPLGGGCFYTPSLSTWRLLAESHAGGEPVDVIVQGTDDTGTAVGRSNRIAVSFSAVSVQGGLYYWTTSQGTGIIRVDFGAVEQVPEKFFPFAGNECYGCHALSPDGRKMSLSRRGQNQGQLGLIKVADAAEELGFTNDNREQFQSWNATSSLFAGIFGDTSDLGIRHQIRIRDGDTGAVVERIDLDHEPDHPDWSPTEDRITYSEVTHHQTSQRPGRCGINTMTRQAGQWGAPQQLIAPETGKNRYAPATAPRGEYFAFVESRCNQADRVYGAECDGDADPTARMFASGFSTGQVVELARANARGRTDQQDELSNTFPKWAPFEQPRFADGSGRVHWMTFSSRRNYGLRTNPNPSGGDQLLWMVAVDPDRVLLGEDGSFPAFLLPFQNINTSNHMAQWTREFVQIGCAELQEGCDPDDPNACCGASVCRADPQTGEGTCEPGPGAEGEGEGEGRCAGINESCAATECCPGTFCSGGDDGVCFLLGG